MIWVKKFSLDAVNNRGLGTLVERLGIRITELGDDFISGTMPVDHRTKQPAGLLHGGANVALAETLGSTAANMVVDSERYYCVGLEINANHIRSCTEGEVLGVSRPIHLGKTTQIWETRISQGDRIVCVSRLTLAVLNKK